MESDEIRELIELISRSNFVSFELEREGFRLRLVKPDPTAPGSPASVAAIAAASAAVSAASEGAASAASPEPAPAPALAATDGLVDLNSPIVGTFFAASSPEAPPFVEVGARVSKGQVLCIVEAMKVMNEIESEWDGEVVEVLVSNGQPVEYGEVLFRLRPST